MFVFSGAQRRGAIVLVSLLCLFSIYYYYNTQIVHPELPSLLMESIETSEQDQLLKMSPTKIQLNSKDPNIWTLNDWKQFGFSLKQIKIIEKYKKTIGGFTSLSQIEKCHVVSFDKFNKLKNHIVFNKYDKIKNTNNFTLVLVDSIPNYSLNKLFDSLYLKKYKVKFYYYVNSDQALKTISDSNLNIKNHGEYSINTNELSLINNGRKRNEIIPFDINCADAIKLTSVNGIGKVFSERIINYRNLLGGFVSANQFKEIYGLKDELCDNLSENILINLDSVKTIDINNVSADVLAKHPYFNWNLVNAIINYRHHHGNFETKRNIKKIHLVNDEIYRKIAPYISVS